MSMSSAIALQSDSLKRYTQNGDLVNTITTLEDGLDLYQFSLLGIDEEGEIFLYYPHDEVILSRLNPARVPWFSFARRG